MGSHRAQGSSLNRRGSTTGRSATSSAASSSPSSEPGDLTGVGRHRAGREHGLHARPTSPVWPSNVPRAGVVGALGVATIVAPIVGGDLLGDPAVGADAVAPQAAPAVIKDVAALSAVPVPQLAAQFRVTATDVTAAVAVAPAAAAEAAPVVTVQGQAMPAEELSALRATAEQASRAQERAVLPSCSGERPAEQPANGRIDTSELCVLWDGENMLRADAAAALARLNAEYFIATGSDLCLTDSYRSYSEQVAVRRQKPGLAARPGTSQHGWGLAIDVCDAQSYSSSTYVWLAENAPSFGWDNPDWALRGGSGPNEPWHWEFEAGQEADAVAAGGAVASQD